jgi:SecD/SecF fusion protein
MWARTCALVAVVLIFLTSPARVAAEPCPARIAPEAPTQTIRLQLDRAENPDADVALDEAAGTLAARLRACGLEEPSVRVVDGSVMVAVPASWDQRDAAALLEPRAVVEFRQEAVVDGQRTWVPAMGQTPDGTLRPFTDVRFLEVGLVTDRATGQPLIEFELDDEGAALLADITAQLVGQPLGLFVDGEPVMTPTVQTAITNGRGQISGGFSHDQARILVAQLTSGPLPAPMWIELEP